MEQGKTFVPTQSVEKPLPVKANGKAVGRPAGKAVSLKDLLSLPEVIQEIDKHKWCESEKAGHDVGIDWAREDWLKRYAEGWKKTNKIP